jgi:hypothetical protein
MTQVSHMADHRVLWLTVAHQATSGTRVSRRDDGTDDDDGSDYRRITRAPGINTGGGRTISTLDAAAASVNSHDIQTPRDTPNGPDGTSDAARLVPLSGALFWARV